jgi:hypothetical protein
MNNKTRLILFILLMHTIAAVAQCPPNTGTCPPNIDFSDPSNPYANWEFTTGTTSNSSGTGTNFDWSWAPGLLPYGSIALGTLGWRLLPIGPLCGTPTASYHQIVTGGIDSWGGFPRVKPGAANSLLLNGPGLLAGCRASRASYTFTIPSTASSYDIVYSYAVVLQDPEHDPWAQPRFQVDAFDVTTGTSVPCGNITFIAGALAATGFFRVADVYYKPWSSSRLDLSGRAGHTIRVSFQIGDCAWYGHWAYAYVDMRCGTQDITLNPCFDGSPGTVTLPPDPAGWFSYAWYNVTTGWTPIPTPPGVSPTVPYTSTATTDYAVVMQPYPGLGCPETLYVHVTPIPTPSPGTIVGPSTICTGTSYTYTNPTGAPGTWSYTASPPSLVSLFNPATGDITTDFTGTGTITLTYTTGLPCPASTSKTITVIAGPVFALTAPEDGSVCSGVPYTICSTPFPITTGCPGGCGYLWGWGGLTTAPCAVHPGVITTIGISTINSLTVTDPITGCSTTHSIGVGIMRAPDAGTIHCPGDFCANDMVSHICTVTGNNAPGVWSMTASGPGVTIDPTYGYLIVNSALITCPTVVTVHFTVTLPPCGSDDATCTFTIFPAPTFAPFYSPNPLCSEPYTLNAGITGGCLGETYTYAWTGPGFSAGFDPVPRPGVGVLYGISIPYNLTVTNNYGCSDTHFLNVDINPMPFAGTIQCPGDFCANDMVSHICTVTGNNAPGVWSITASGPGVTIDPTYGYFIVNSALITCPTVVTVHFTVTLPPCGSDDATCTFTIFPAPTFAPFYSPNPLCSEPYTLHAGITGGCLGETYTYAWTGPGFSAGFDPVPRPGVGVLYGISIPYNLTVTNNYGCSDTHFLNVDINPMPFAGTIHCPGNFCASVVSHTCTVTGNNAPGVWSIAPAVPGVTIDPTYGYLTVTPGLILCPEVVTVHYTVTLPPCGTDETTCTFVVSPDPIIAPYYLPNPLCSEPYTLYSGHTGGCPGETFTYSWTGPGFSAGFDPVTRPGVFVAYGISIPYSLTITNNYGCSSTRSLSVDINAMPVAGTIHCPGNFCASDNVSHICTVSGNNEPGVWSIAPAVPGVTIDPTYGYLIVNSALITCPEVVTVHYTVTLPPCGTDDATCTFVVSQDPVIAPYYLPNPLCSGTPYTLYSGITICSLATYTYLWTGLGGFTAGFDPVPRPGAGAIYGISIPYTLTVTDNYGCSTTQILSVDINPAPDACVHYGSDPICSCLTFIFTGTAGAQVEYDFYDCTGVLIPGGPHLTPPLTATGYALPLALIPAGTCMICINNIQYMGCVVPCNCPSGCCARLNKGGGRAQNLPGVIADENGNGDNNSLALVPNPNKGSFTISGSLNGNMTLKEVKIEVVDMLGKTIYTDAATIENGSISKEIRLGDNVANGIYLVRIKNDEVSQVIRFSLSR